MIDRLKDLSDQPRTFWIGALVITALRIVTLIVSPAELGPDEAQYWFWAQTPDFGYFSKPPLIAWAIAATTALFGDAPAAARLSAPLFHFGAAAFLYFAAQRLFDQRAAVWTGLSWLTLPGVILSSFVIATDAPLLFFWSAGLFMLARIITADRAPGTDFLLLGAAVGLGMMAKYAMIYFPAAMIVAMASPPFRAKLLRPPLALVGLVALALFAPNIVWNSQHDFQTLSHTAANANWSRELFRPLSLVRFAGEQFAVFGPILFGAFIVSAATALRRVRRAAADPNAFLIAFALTPLLIVAGQAFLSRAHANWGAAAFPAALLFTIGALLAHRRERWVFASLGLHGLLFALFTAAMIFATAVAAGPFGAAMKSVRGWERVTADIMAQADGYDAVVIDDRYLIAEMVYYQRDADIPIAALDPNGSVDNHYEAFTPFDPARMKRVLFVTLRDDAAHADYRFSDIRRIGVVDAGIGGRKPRSYALYEISGYFGPGAP